MATKKPTPLLSHKQRQCIIEAPWPTINVWAGKSHGGAVRGETWLPGGRSKFFSYAKDKANMYDDDEDNW